MTGNWIKSVGNYIVYANVTDADTSGIASVTATTGIVGGATTSFSLSASSGTCAGTSYSYTSALKTGPTLIGSQTFFADVIATDPATNVTHTDVAQTANVGVDVVAPAIVTVSHTNGGFLSGLIHLNWTASTETGSGLAGYQLNVFSHNTTNHPSQYPNPIVVSGSTLTMNFTIPLLTAFDFTVTPVDNAGNNGAAGSQNNVTGP